MCSPSSSFGLVQRSRSVGRSLNRRHPRPIPSHSVPFHRRCRSRAIEPMYTVRISSQSAWKQTTRKSEPKLCAYFARSKEFGYENFPIATHNLENRNRKVDYRAIQIYIDNKIEYKSEFFRNTFCAHQESFRKLFLLSMLKKLERMRFILSCVFRFLPLNYFFFFFYSYVSQKPTKVPLSQLKKFSRSKEFNVTSRMQPSNRGIDNAIKNSLLDSLIKSLGCSAEFVITCWKFAHTFAALYSCTLSLSLFLSSVLVFPGGHASYLTLNVLASLPFPAVSPGLPKADANFAKFQRITGNHITRYMTPCGNLVSLTIPYACTHTFGRQRCQAF